MPLLGPWEEVKQLAQHVTYQKRTLRAPAQYTFVDTFVATFCFSFLSSIDLVSILYRVYQGRAFLAAFGFYLILDKISVFVFTTLLQKSS